MAKKAAAQNGRADLPVSQDARLSRRSKAEADSASVTGAHGKSAEKRKFA
jgi:hypothetical protein